MQKVLLLFGVDIAASICSYLARKIGPYLKVSNIAHHNLIKVLGSNCNHRKIINEVWDNFGRFIGEFPYINKLPDSEIEKRIEIVGIEHLAELNAKSKPFLIFTSHSGNWDFILKIVTKLYPKFGIIYRRANNPYVDQALLASRNKENVHLIAKGPLGVKNMIKAIKNGYSIAMLVDQKMNDGIEVPFFGFPAMTSYAIARFALQFDYPIIPVESMRKNNSSEFKVIIHPPLNYQKTHNKQQDYYNIMLQINQILEDWIRQNPGQWFWFHNRWK